MWAYHLRGVYTLDQPSQQPEKPALFPVQEEETEAQPEVTQRLCYAEATFESRLSDSKIIIPSAG